MITVNTEDNGAVREVFRVFTHGGKVYVCTGKVFKFHDGGEIVESPGGYSKPTDGWFSSIDDAFEAELNTHDAEAAELREKIVRAWEAHRVS